MQAARPQKSPESTGSTPSDPPPSVSSASTLLTSCSLPPLPPNPGGECGSARLLRPSIARWVRCFRFSILDQVSIACHCNSSATIRDSCCRSTVAAAGRWFRCSAQRHWPGFCCAERASRDTDSGSMAASSWVDRVQERPNRFDGLLTNSTNLVAAGGFSFSKYVDLGVHAEKF